jgi:hypothetical protein
MRRGVRKYAQSRRERKKRKKRLLISGLFAFFALFILVWGGTYLWKKVKRQPAQKEQLKKETPPPFSFLLVGIEGEKLNLKKVKSTGLMVGYYNPTDQEINAIFVPAQTLMEVPGIGFDQVGKALAGGVPSLLLGVKNFFGVQIDHYFLLNQRDFAAVLSQSKFEIALKNPLETDIDKKMTALILESFEEIPSDSQKIVPLPTEAVTMGGETYTEPQREEIERLVALIWGKSSESIQQAPKVIVLNGCGAPGIGGKVAGQLIEQGFRVIDIKNADNFDYKVTQINSSDESREAALQIKNILGTGLVKIERQTQELVDVTIIIGQDYLTLTEETTSTTVPMVGY